jgi:hypothetical protein
MRLVFTALMDFDLIQWENVCPQVFELVQDVRRHAGRLSLTVETLLELLMCDVDSDFGYFKKSCAFSECKTCRVHDFFNNLTIRDGLPLPGSNDEIPVEIKYGAYIKVELPSLDKEESSRSKLKLGTRTATPSEFLDRLSVSLAEHSEHKYIAIHQTEKRARLNFYLKENLGPDARACQMVFVVLLLFIDINQCKDPKLLTRMVDVLWGSYLFN